MYSILEACGNNSKRAKGVPKVVLKKDLRHEHYKQCLVEGIELKNKQVAIRSNGHQMGSMSR
jgi:hypothetical protein